MWWWPVAISTYAELKVAIQSWSKRNDILTVMDDFIDLAEADMGERLKVRNMEARATATASTSSRFVELPDGYISMRRLSIYSGGNRRELQSTTPESMKVRDGAGAPAFFAITSEIEFDRIPDSAYTVEMQYFRSLTALSAAAPSNDILTRFPMIYLYGSMMHFANWAMDDEVFNKYSLLFQGAIDSANKSDRRGRHSPGAAMRVEGSTP